MQQTTAALAGATEKGSWTARIRNGETHYRHESGLETTDRRVVEQTIQPEAGGAT